MKRLNVLRNHRAKFKVIAEGGASQAAMMTLKSGKSSSERLEDEHPKAEQRVHVISGSGRAKFKGRSVQRREGAVLQIEKTEAHQITNTEKAPSVTLNLYPPPAYQKNGGARVSVE